MQLEADRKIVKKMFAVKTVLFFWSANEEKQFSFKLNEEGMWKWQQNERS